MLRVQRLQGFFVTASVYLDEESQTIWVVYSNASGEAVDRLFNPTWEQINCRLAELDGIE